MASSSNKLRPAVLRNTPTLSDKKYAIVSMISPENPRQKSQVYGWKLYDTCGDIDTAHDLAAYYRDLDQDFDVYVGELNTWLPWVWDPMEIKDARYANKQLEELVAAKREQAKQSNTQWHRKVDQSIQDIQKAFTPEGQEALAKEKEPAPSMLFKIRQLEFVIKRRKQELENMRAVYKKNYSREEQRKAAKVEFPPITEIAPMDYVLLNSAPQESSSGAGDPSVNHPLDFSESSQSEVGDGNSNSQTPSALMQQMVDSNAGIPSKI